MAAGTFPVTFGTLETSYQKSGKVNVSYITPDKTEFKRSLNLCGLKWIIAKIKCNSMGVFRKMITVVHFHIHTYPYDIRNKSCRNLLQIRTKSHYLFPVYRFSGSFNKILLVYTVRTSVFAYRYSSHKSKAVLFTSQIQTYQFTMLYIKWYNSLQFPCTLHYVYIYFSDRSFMSYLGFSLTCL